MKNKLTLKEAIAKAYKDLRKADRIIKKRRRYFCGLTEEASSGDLFFESPDGQNGELYYEMRKLKWLGSGFNAEYYWGVSKNGVRISYVEGDIYIKELKFNN